MGRKKTKNVYWTEETEQAIIDYNNETNERIKNQIFSQQIHYPLTRLVEAVYNQVKPQYVLDSQNDLMNEVLSHLLSIFPRLNENKGRSFSYLTVSARNYFIIESKKGYKKAQRDYYIDSFEEFDLEFYDYHSKRMEDVDRFHTFLDYIERNIDSIFSTKRIVKLAQIVLHILRNEEITTKKDFYTSYVKLSKDLDYASKTTGKVAARRVLLIIIKNWVLFNEEWERSGMIIKDSDCLKYSSRDLTSLKDAREGMY